MPTIFMAAYTKYGSDPRVKREAELMVAAGFDVVFMACREPGEPDRESLRGVEIIRTYSLKSKPRSFGAYICDYLLFFFALSAHLTLHPLRYRVIHINNMPDFLVFAAWLPRILGRPLIHDIHDLMPELFSEKFSTTKGNIVLSLLRLQERWAGRFATSVITVENRLKDILSERGIPREKIHVFMNLPDDSIFSLQTDRPTREDGRFVMVYHGTLARRLGLDIAIRAVGNVRDRIPKIEFRIIGAGEERESLIALRDELGLHDAVTFSDGYVPVEQIPELVGDADVGVIPLRISSGTDIMLPTKLLEYVNLGIPCLTPRTGTIQRYFDESMVHFFVAEDVDSLADGLYALFADPEKRASLVKNSRDKFLSKYTWSEHKKIYVDLVRSLSGDGDER